MKFPFAANGTLLCSIRYERAARFGSARTRSSSVSRRSGSKRAITSGRSAREADRSKPVASPKPTVVAVPTTSDAASIGGTVG